MAHQGLARKNYLSLSQTLSHWRIAANRSMLHPMGEVLKLIWRAVIGLFRSRASLTWGGSGQEIEIHTRIDNTPAAVLVSKV